MNIYLRRGNLTFCRVESDWMCGAICGLVAGNLRLGVVLALRGNAVRLDVVVVSELAFCSLAAPALPVHPADLFAVNDLHLLLPSRHVDMLLENSLFLIFFVPLYKEYMNIM